MTDYPFVEGDLVRIKKTGREGILAEVNPNENFVPDGEYWAELMDPTEAFHFLSDIENPEDIELVTKAADFPVKRLPTFEELRNFLSSAVHSGGSDIRIDESGPDGEDALEVCGRLDNQRFVARIKIDYITWID